MNDGHDALREVMGLLFQSHPWHGLAPGPDCPEVVTVFVELVPTDTVKFEIDKTSGHLRLDRPQRYSSLAPEPYGFVPRTLCGAHVAALAARALKRPTLDGDLDPLDVCVLTERAITHGNVVVRARPIGGLRMLDGAEVDDKIIAVLESDPTYEALRSLEDCPAVLIDRLQHYFLTYKDMPGSAGKRIELAGIYDAADARAVIAAAQRDYAERYGDLDARLARALAAAAPREA